MLVNGRERKCSPSPNTKSLWKLEPRRDICSNPTSFREESSSPMVFVSANDLNIEIDIGISCKDTEDLIGTEDHTTIISFDVDGMTGRTDDASHQIEAVTSVHYSSSLSEKIVARLSLLLTSLRRKTRTVLKLSLKSKERSSGSG